MRKKWIPLLIVISLAALLYIWQGFNKDTKMAEILNNIPYVDYVNVTDQTTDETVFVLTEENPLFDEVANVYTFYLDLSWSERELLDNQPAYTVHYFVKEEEKFTLDIYKVVEDDFPLIPADHWTGIMTIPFKYTSPHSKAVYILAATNLNQLINFNDGMKELVNVLEENYEYLTGSVEQ